MNKLNRITITMSILLIFTMCLCIFTGCSSDSDNNNIPSGSIKLKSTDDSAIADFINSETFQRHKTDIEKYGEINYDDIDSSTIDYGNDKISCLGMPISKNGKVIGLVEIVDLKSSTHLPNKDTYAMNYVDMSEFNNQSLTGVIKMFDLNYGNFEHSKITIKNNKIKSWELIEASDEIKKIYGLGKTKNVRLKSGAIEEFDTDHDGDVSFSECYKGINDEIDKNGTSQWICDFPVLGWASCWTSVTLACLYISANY